LNRTSRKVDKGRPRHETRTWLRILELHNAIFATLNRTMIVKAGISLAKFDILAQLDLHRDGISLGVLSEQLRVTDGNITGLVRRLLADGLIVKEMSRVDRRSFLVSLSPQGVKKFQAACVIHREHLERLFAQVADEDLDETASILARVIAGVRAANHGGRR
jgi:DNA-binding MarR family transcriptional regulator